MSVNKNEKGLLLGKSTVYYKNKPDAVSKEPESNCFINLEYKRKTAVPTADAITRIRKEVIAGKCTNPEVAVLSAHELQRMKQQSKILTKEERIAQQKLYAEQEEKQQAKGQAKRKKMLELEQEMRLAAPPLTDMEREDLEKKGALRKNAEEIHNENRDEVKKMNQLINYAKCATVREKQIEEKDRIVKQKIDEIKRIDLMMEIDRLKAIEDAEAKAASKKEEEYKGKAVIIDQIKEREIDRMLSKDELAKEAQAMLRLAKQLENEEKMNRLKQKETVRIKQDEIYEANQAATEKKQVRYQRERDEDEKIVKYNLEKAEKEAEYLAEQKRIRDEKERETAKLREMQEKAQDRQAEIDALRAKRATEKNERFAREKERKEAEMKHLK